MVKKEYTINKKELKATITFDKKDLEISEEQKYKNIEKLINEYFFRIKVTAKAMNKAREKYPNNVDKAIKYFEYLQSNTQPQATPHTQADPTPHEEK